MIRCADSLEQLASFRCCFFSSSLPFCPRRVSTFSFFFFAGSLPGWMSLFYRAATGARTTPAVIAYGYLRSERAFRYKTIAVYLALFVTAELHLFERDFARHPTSSTSASFRLLPTASFCNVINCFILVC